MLERCEENRWAVADSYTPQRTEGTWFHSRFGTWHQLDHFLVPKDELWSVRRCHNRKENARGTTWQGWNGINYQGWTDHRPIEIWLRRAKWGAPKRPPKVDKPAVDRLRGPTQEAARLRQEFTEKMEERIGQLPQGPTNWNDLAKTMKEVAMEVVGPQQPRIREQRPWMQGKECETRKTLKT